ncbi:MAG TPA: PAS domain-containing protein [Candidatus Acidoferrum sp.]|nr:PAS domain-containing protein [Candidatus Acidoferrum sp.]
MAPSFDIASVSSAKVRQLHAHWERVRGARLMPTRTDIDPSAIKPLLPNIVMADVFHDPLRVYYRLVGTAVVEHSRFDFTGKWLHEVEFGEPKDWIALYELFVREKRPLFDRSEIPFEDAIRPPQPYEFCMLPLSADGATVTGMISLEDYGVLSLLERTRVGKVKTKPPRA